MSTKKHWPRWIFASTSKFFEGKREGVDFYIEGDERTTSTSQDYFEFRIDGPLISEPSKDAFYLYVMVNILVVHKLNQKDFHQLHNLVGVAVDAFENCIPVMKYGNGTDDDRAVQFGVLQLVNPDKEDSVQVSHLGQVNPDTKEMQAIVQAYYCMYHKE